MERCRRRIKETEERVFLKKKRVMQSADALFTFVYLSIYENLKRTLLLPRKCLKACVCVGVRTHTMCMLEAVFVE